ncbi:MAG: hypothetical protein ACI32N_05625 [Bulleidia sp.]
MQEIEWLESMQLSYDDTSLPEKLLKEAFDYHIHESQLITEKVYRDVVKHSDLILTPKEGEEKLRLTVDASDEMMQQYQDGAIKLANEKGHLVAQIKENGKYGRKLPIKEETYIDGSTSLEIQNALRLQEIQQSLEKISEQIQAIDMNVKEVLTGQQNDRLGLYYSGVAQFLEAYSIHDQTLQKQMIANALKTLTDSVFQLTLTLQTDILYLARKEYAQNKKYMFNLINEKIDNINQSFLAIHQATVMKSAIYCMQGEIKAMVSVLYEYEKFIEGTIVKNASMISSCDRSEQRKIAGTWKKRAALKLEVAEVVKQLQKPSDVLYIERKEGNSNESI